MTQPVVLITGALTGIGRATAVAFARDGARLIISGRHAAEGQTLAQELRDLGAEVEFVKADVRREEEVRNLVDQSVSRFGRLDIAVNNAGTEGQSGPLTEQTPANFAATFEVNVLGVVLSLKHELRVMSAQRHGSIINISSVAGRIGFPGASIYVASKHAVEGLTKAAALEAAATNVRVNAVAPGPIETAMLNRFVGSDENKKRFQQSIPLQRIGTADEVAQTILFLASEKASYVTGQSYAVDGGRLAS